MFPRPGRSYSGRLTAAFDGRAVLAVQEMPEEFYGRWGFVAVGGEPHDGLVDVVGAVEKPGTAAPSPFGLPGRYVFTAEIFDLLAGQEPGHGGEIQLTDAIDSLARQQGAIGVIVGDDLFDTGIPAGRIEAAIVMGLERPELADGLRAMLEGLSGSR